MEIVVIGGTGLIGTKLDSSLTPDGGARIMPTHFEDWLAQSLAGSR